MKLLLPFSILLLSISNILAQDTIQTIDNKLIISIVKEINDSNIRYLKYDNQEGPLYTILKSKTATIQFKNGTSETYNNLGLSIVNNPKFEKFKIENLDRIIEYDYRLNESAIFQSKFITYFGFDYEHFTLVNSKKIGQDNELSFLFPKSIIKFEDNIPPHKWIKNKLKVDSLYIEKESIELKYSNKKIPWIKSSCINLKIEHIAKIVENYTINKNTGIGFVIIVQSFDKPKETSNLIYTFFDIETRELLWVTKINGEAEDAGFVRHWFEGIDQSISLFMGLYRKSLKKYEKQL